MRFRLWGRRRARDEEILRRLDLVFDHLDLIHNGIIRGLRAAHERELAAQEMAGAIQGARTREVAALEIELERLRSSLA